MPKPGSYNIKSCELPRTPEAEPFKFELFSEIEPDPRKAWLVEDMLGDGELSVAFGVPGSGKSVLVGDGACHVAAGLPWHGRAVMRGGVLYVAAERAGLVKRRFAAWRKRHGINDLPLAVLSGTFNFASGDDIKRLIETSKTFSEIYEPVRWIIIDTKAQVLGGADENAAKDAMGFVASLAKLQHETGAHVTVVDHVPHADQTRMRGHGALLGAADTTFRISKQVTGARLCEVDKANDGPEEVRFAFNLESELLGADPETGKETTAPVVVPADAALVPAKSAPRLTDAERVALKQLGSALADEGDKAPASDHVPNVPVVSTDLWRRYCYQGGISPSDTTEARKKAFMRAAKGLQAKGLIAVWEPYVWLVREQQLDRDIGGQSGTMSRHVPGQDGTYPFRDVPIVPSVPLGSGRVQ
jgi:hypothetical protein